MSEITIALLQADPEIGCMIQDQPRYQGGQCRLRPSRQFGPEQYAACSGYAHCKQVDLLQPAPVCRPPSVLAWHGPFPDSARGREVIRLKRLRPKLQGPCPNHPPKITASVANAAKLIRGRRIQTAAGVGRPAKHPRLDLQPSLRLGRIQTAAENNAARDAQSLGECQPEDLAMRCRGYNSSRNSVLWAFSRLVVQRDSPACLSQIQITGTGAIRGSTHRVAGFATWGGSASHAGATASIKLVFDLDHSMWTAHCCRRTKKGGIVKYLVPAGPSSFDGRRETTFALIYPGFAETKSP